jgi:ABC-type sugar transport system ATPase subunit
LLIFAPFISGASQLLQRLGCQFTAEELVENLSTGDRQMVEIAREIREEPRIIIFDEPIIADRARKAAAFWDYPPPQSARQHDYLYHAFHG